MVTLSCRDNGYYYVEWSENGRRRRKSFKTKNKEYAQQLYLVHLEKLHRRQLGLCEDERVRTDAAIAVFLEHRTMLRPQTLEWYAGRLAMWQEYIGAGRLLNAVWPDDVMRFRDKRLKEVAPNTVRGNLRAIRALYLYWINVKEVKMRCPVTRDTMRISGGSTTRNLALTPTERVIYEERLTGALKHVYVLGVYAGLRRSEMCMLEREDFRHGSIIIGNKPHMDWEVKDHQERRIPVQPEVLAIMPEFPQTGLVLRTRVGAPWSPRYLSQAWRTKMEQLELPPRRTRPDGRSYWGAGLHDLRRTYASMMIQEYKLDVFTLARRLGHSEIATTQRYLFEFDR